jgi:hypothetical protein
LDVSEIYGSNIYANSRVEKRENHIMDDEYTAGLPEEDEIICQEEGDDYDFQMPAFLDRASLKNSGKS